jgi:hypothetical protein
MIHVLHIGKTGGTAIKAALEPHQDRFRLHGHSVRLSDCPQGELVFFALRHPIDRFVSSFNSRLRQGLPRYFFEWTAGEASAFRQFSTANELAEALSSFNLLRWHKAQKAMRNIRHVKQHLDYWLGSTEYLISRQLDIMIGNTATLQSDFARLLALAGLEAIDLPSDPFASHKTPETMERHLSDAARLNLSKWYAADIALYDSATWLRRDGISSVERSDS